MLVNSVLKYQKTELAVNKFFSTTDWLTQQTLANWKETLTGKQKWPLPEARMLTAFPFCCLFPSWITNTRFQEAQSGTQSRLGGLSAEKHKLLCRPNQELGEYNAKQLWACVLKAAAQSEWKKNNQSLNWFQMFFRPKYLMHRKGNYLHQICPHHLHSSLEQNTLNLEE